MSENEKKEQPAASQETTAVPAPAEPQVKLKPGLFQPFTLGTTLKQGSTGNVVTNVKPNPMDYEKTYKESSKNQQLTAEELAGTVKKASDDEVDEVLKSKFKEVSEGIQRKNGYSKERADKIAAVMGRKKLGEKEMERRSEEGRKKEDKK